METNTILWSIAIGASLIAAYYKFATDGEFRAATIGIIIKILKAWWFFLFIGMLVGIYLFVAYAFARLTTEAFAITSISAAKQMSPWKTALYCYCSAFFLAYLIIVPFYQFKAVKRYYLKRWGWTINKKSGS